ncbi:hypothetical protein Glove_85g66 [Diversispora epigaea]|uniref:Uncharacterized protein n=1 Tax=Diversispora epigaea TaxID=1348612 RepID=A0A397J7S3_9GLOM|nr:hypothetical protein Glove_85g66 [Diversispora epigaea]
MEVKLTIPKELHPKFQDYSMCPERKNVPYNWYSSKQKEWTSKQRSDTEKLILTLHEKDHYIIHYRNLQQCIRESIWKDYGRCEKMSEHRFGLTDDLNFIKEQLESIETMRNLLREITNNFTYSGINWRLRRKLAYEIIDIYKPVNQQNDNLIKLHMRLARSRKQQIHNISYSRVRDKLSEYGDIYVVNNIKTPEAWLRFAKYYPPKYIRKRLLKLGYEINSRDYWKNFVFRVENNLTSHKQIGNNPKYRDFKVQLVLHKENRTSLIIQQAYRLRRKQINSAKIIQNAVIK